MNMTFFLWKYQAQVLYRELGPSLWYLNGPGVWEDMQRFKFFGEFS